MRAVVLVPLLATLAVPAVTAVTPEIPRSSAEAFQEGNRRFHAGDLEGAMDVWASFYDGSDPRFAYNLGTAAHHLERLPEALLWYRRAEAAQVDDPWLRENLELVRGQLRDEGAQGEPGSVWSFWMDQRHRLVLLGALLSWAALPAVLWPSRPRTRTLALAAVAVAAGLPGAAGLLLDWHGPPAAVLLRDCSGPQGGGLAAGSEVRVFPADGRGWRVPETGLVCPEDAVGLVDRPPAHSASAESLVSSS